MDAWGKDNIATYNAYHAGNVCYTEDNIIVYNLYVSNIPKSVTEKHLENYFAKYGEIHSVAIVQRRKIKSPFRYAFVNFKKPESAAKALKVAIHIVQAKRVKVKAADSWKQPTTKQESNKNDNNDDNVPPNSILKLNDDCLLYLFTFLPLSDKLKMSGICERFQTIFETIFKIEKSLDLDKVGYLTLMEVRQIVTKVGYLIERISFTGKYIPNNHKRLIEFLPNFCQNVKILQLESVNSIHADTFRRIANNLKLIKKLELINCDINDQICLHLSQLQDIEILNLSENYELTGKYLCNFTNLKQLSLNNCLNIQAIHFIELCNVVNTTLRELHIKRCDRLNENTYELMATTLINLETLTISTNYQAEKLTKLADLKYLKNLTIYCCTNIKDDLFINFSNKTEHTLEKLNIFNGSLNNKKMSMITSIKTIKELRIPYDPEIDDDFLLECSKYKSLEHLDVTGCENITKNGIIGLLKGSDSLKVLDMSLCQQFDDDFIYKVFDILKNKARYESYKLNVGRTKISSTILNDPKYIENRKYVELSFDLNSNDLNLYDDEDDDNDYEDYGSENGFQGFDVDDDDDDDFDFYPDEFYDYYEMEYGIYDEFDP